MRRKIITIANPARIKRKTISKVKKSVSHAISFLKTRSADVGIVIADEKLISYLNHTYLRHKGATDVIAFSLQSGDRELSGEVYLGSRQIMRNSRLYGTSYERELCFSAVHGVLHLAGYRDDTDALKKQMWKMQDEILRQAGI